MLRMLPSSVTPRLELGVGGTSHEFPTRTLLTFPSRGLMPHGVGGEPQGSRRET